MSSSFLARLGLVAVAAGLAAVLPIALRSDEAGAPAPPAGSSPVARTTPAREFGPLDDRVPEIGKPAPDFRLLKADGVSVVRLGELRGKPVLVNFWASWCGPCRQEMPDINAAYLEAQGRLEVLGVNLKEPDLVARGFGYNLDIAFPLVLDSDGSVAEQYRIQGLPVSYFIDSEGIIRERHIGYMTRDVLRTKLKSILR